ncbi:molybdate ABC transporter substrate-binding protein [Janibacter anophelis]|uniref:molybdate ABC transporter substrate-binding protein n=1 Tax=Janibacter anophelis TaxID=319054 RepID=UPI001966A017|nr:molybdate ABC transporter substrate-binding protein [Janibacter anophelis]
MRGWRAGACVAPLALALAACGSGSGSGSDDGGTTTLRVAAAASLTASFEEIATDFEAANEGVELEFQFAGSSDLATQISNGAELDVFASADEATMDKVADLTAADPMIFATNVLTIVTEPGNPQQITGLQDLESSDLAVVVCAEQVPCGAATKALTEQQDVTLDPASEESKVTGVLTKVTTGEADAGLVYVTDATGAGDQVETVEAEDSDEVVNSYPIAVLDGAPSPDEAQAFVDFVTGPEGQAVLQDKGFGTP